MTHAHRLKIRCFLEGIEVPVIAVSINVQPNAPAQFQVQIPATDKSHRFHPRTLIHVFFHDYWGGPSDTLDRRVRSDPPQVLSQEDMLSELAERSAEANRTGTDDVMGLGDSATEEEQRAAIERARILREQGAIIDTAFPEEGAPTSAAARQASGEIDEHGFRTEMHVHGAPDTFQPYPYAALDDHWKLLLSGEVIGYEFAKSHTRRNVVLHCMDLSIYWDTCYQYQVNVASLTGDGMAAFVGAGTTFFDTFFSSTTSSIVEAVNRTSVTQPELTGLLSGVVRLLESVGGVYTGNESQSLNGANPQNVRHRFRGVNDFFSIAELRLKLVYQITAAEGDESSRRHFARRAFAMWGRRYASRLGKIASFREILNVMMQYIYHSVFPIPAPRFVHPSERLRTSTRTATSAFSASPRGRNHIQQLTAIRNAASYVRNDMRSTGRVLTTAQINSRLYRVESQCGRLAQTSRGFGHSSPASNLVIAGDQARQLRTLYPGGIRGTGPQQPIYQRTRQTIEAQSTRMINNIRIALNFYETATTSSSRSSSRTVETGKRLNAQVIRPDIFMCSPPRCNVIFPELYSQLSFSRMYMKEVTRMRLTVSDEIFGPEALLDSVYYAPDIEVLGAHPPRRRYGRGSNTGQVTGRRLSRAAYSKRLMEHELYTGVVPVFERMNEVNIYAARTDQVSVRGARIPYVMRAVNHQFFKHRWEARQMNVQAKFNPYLVPGFPAVVIDRWLTQEQVDNTALRGVQYLEATGNVAEVAADAGEIETDSAAATAPGDVMPAETVSEQYDAWNVLREQVPTQFVGLIEQMSHNVTQGDANTTLVLTHARTHRENEELLGSNTRELTRRSLIRRTGRGRSRPTVGTPSGGTAATSPTTSLPAGTPGRRRSRFIEGRALKTTTVATIETPQVGMVGPYFGEVIEVTPSTRTGSLPLFGTFFGDRVRRQRRTYPVGVPLRAVDLGQEVTVQAGGEDQTVTLTAWTITEAIDRWRGQEVEVPLEDFIRPPWMADVWKNDQIGGTYQQFFGTGAITDTMVLDIGSRSLDSSHQADPVEDLLAYEAQEERERSVRDPIRADGRTIQSAGQQITIERAIDLLVRSYSSIKHHQQDIHEFIRAYTWRPVATMTDIFGTPDLQIDPDGRVTEGTPGLHSLAFGHGPLGQNLRNLVDLNARQILGMETGLVEVHRRSRRVPPPEGAPAGTRPTRSTSTSRTVESAEERSDTLRRMDKRAEKAQRVMDYVEELSQSRGLLG